MRRGWFVVVTLMSLAELAPRASRAQQVASAADSTRSVIVVSGHAEVRIPADRATIMIAVETRGSTASAAGAENARVQQAVLASLRAVGVDSGQVSTAGYSVEPNWRQDKPDRPPKLDGYTARNALRVELTRLDRLGAVIDTALGAGANRIDNVEFSASDLTEPRRTVLAKAIENARGDAEIMARAAGGTLGALLELSTTPYQPQPYRLGEVVVTAQAGRAPTPIIPREIVVSATVLTRWRFVSRP